MKIVFENDDIPISKEELKLLIKDEVNNAISNKTIYIVLSEEDANKIASSIPDSIIIDKVRKHVKQTGSSGLAGDVLNNFK